MWPCQMRVYVTATESDRSGEAAKAEPQAHGTDQAAWARAAAAAAYELKLKQNRSYKQPY